MKRSYSAVRLGGKNPCFLYTAKISVASRGASIRGRSGDTFCKCTKKACAASCDPNQCSANVCLWFAKIQNVFEMNSMQSAL